MIGDIVTSITDKELKKDYFYVNLIFLFYILIFRNSRLGQIVTLMVV
mgnify:CR=1 FL=1